MDKWLIIPDYNSIEESIKIAGEYGVGFEYNDFFMPGVLDDEDALWEKIKKYQTLQSREEYPVYCTSHGAFLDVTIFSDDAKIKDISVRRVRQSLEISKKLSMKGVVFHTNYIANFKASFYQENWLNRNEIFWREMCKEYPDVNIYIENMFDDSPELLARLAEKLKDVPNFGVCFDYAHAHVFGEEKEIDKWVEALAPYIKHVHINDNDFHEDLHLAVGDGKIDWDKFKANREKFFPDASILVEVSGEEKIRKSLNYLVTKSLL